MYHVHDGSVSGLPVVNLSLGGSPFGTSLGDFGRSTGDRSRTTASSSSDWFADAMREGGKELVTNAVGYGVDAIGDLAKGFTNIGTNAAVERLAGKAGTDAPMLDWQVQQQQQQLALERQRMEMQAAALQQQMELERQRLQMQAQASVQPTAPTTGAGMTPYLGPAMEKPAVEKKFPAWAWVLIALGGAAVVGGVLYFTLGREKEDA